MSKKTLIIIIAAVLVVVLAAVGIYFGFDKLKGGKDGSSSTNSDIVSSEQADDEENYVAYKAEVKIVDNPGYTGYDLVFGYDSETFTFVKCEGGLVNPSIVSETADGEVSVVGVVSQNEDSKEKGTMFTLVFKAKKEPATGEYEIKTLKSEFANWNEQFVKATVSADKIIVK